MSYKPFGFTKFMELHFSFKALLRIRLSFGELIFLPGFGFAAKDVQRFL